MRSARASAPPEASTTDVGAITLLLGGARSGKSALAVELGRRHPGAVTFLATCPPFDGELGDRVARHRAERPDWPTVEEPCDLAAALRSAGEDLVLVDCLTLWVNNLIHRGEGLVVDEVVGVPREAVADGEPLDAELAAELLLADLPLAALDELHDRDRPAAGDAPDHDAERGRALALAVARVDDHHRRRPPQPVGDRILGGHLVAHPEEHTSAALSCPLSSVPSEVR